VKPGRNDPCTCGSGKKWKKCCAVAGTALAEIKISTELKEKLSQKVWLHGTKVQFNKWSSSPPSKDPWTLAHTALFFTTDWDYARGAGHNIARSSLSDRAKVLDTTFNYEGSEALRRSLEKDSVVSLYENAKPEYWHKCWKTGDVLRPLMPDDRVSRVRSLKANHHLQLKIRQYMAQGLREQEAQIATLHNETRHLIETICVHAKRLGYDALYGYEVDRHSGSQTPIARPWLAVMTPSMLSDPEWFQET